MRHLLKRRNELSNNLQALYRGVNYFVLQLERMGIRTRWSCEGHPAGFYITFHATYEQALRIKPHGYFTVEVEGLHYWSMRFSRQHKTTRERKFSLRLSASAWEQAFGPLDQKLTGGLRLMTMLKRKLIRETSATVFELGRHRAVMVSLEPPCLIGLRLKRTLRTFYLSVDKAYLAAVKAPVAAEAREKSQRRKKVRR